MYNEIVMLNLSKNTIVIKYKDPMISKDNKTNVKTDIF